MIFLGKSNAGKKIIEIIIIPTKKNIENNEFLIIFIKSEIKSEWAEGLWQKGGYALRKLYHDSNKPLMVVYTSPSCGPCHVLKPQLQRVINELDGAAQAIVIDIESDQEIAEQAGVSGTPTIQLFHHKEMVKQWRGVKQRSEFKQAIEALIR